MALRTWLALSGHRPLTSNSSFSIAAPRVPTQSHGLRARVSAFPHEGDRFLMPAVHPSKRKASQAIFAVLLNGCGLSASMATLRQEVNKAGATVLFEEPAKESNNVGVGVSPVCLASLREFGSPQFVADKLIQAEKRKESERVLGFSLLRGEGNGAKAEKLSTTRREFLFLLF
ncbi:hypothetical protein ACJRO7_033631 [Eucalyptus globulus]|uniref:PsbP C-terminal domain-containing protein n=1 Tax=Eucalyptus globulus TaxID=34317 RepID=A0ABD3JZZ1_EUCGL